MKVYHYTTKAGLQGIMASGKIRASSRSAGGGDAAFGSGVYFTTIPPSSSDYDIIINNWDGLPQNFPEVYKMKQEEGGVRYALGFDVPSHLLQQADTDRDVWLYKGDFDIRSFGVEVHHRENADPVMTGSALATM